MACFSHDTIVAPEKCIGRGFRAGLVSVMFRAGLKSVFILEK